FSSLHHRVLLSFPTRRSSDLPYPPAEPTEPPRGLVAFCLHYSRGAKRWLALMAVTAAAIAAGEIVLFGFIGDVVNWLAGADPDRSEEHTSELQSRENLVCRLL